MGCVELQVCAQRYICGGSFVIWLMTEWSLAFLFLLRWLDWAEKQRAYVPASQVEPQYLQGRVTLPQGMVGGTALHSCSTHAWGLCMGPTLQDPCLHRIYTLGLCIQVLCGGGQLPSF